MSGNDKGKFSTDISQQVIEEALRSVQPGRTTIDPESADAPSIDSSGDPALAPAAGTNGELEEVRAQLLLSQEKGRELLSKLQETHERMLRAAADLDNYRKRAVKEKEEIQKFGSEKLLTDFLPVVDNLDRALDHARTSSDFESLLKGVSMTRKLFEAALAKHGVKSFRAAGQPFDPHLHEAMQHVETADIPPNHIASELVPGYLLNERLLRPALVVVAKAQGQAATGDPEGGSGTEDSSGSGSEQEDQERR